MNSEMQMLILSLVAKVGFEATIALLENMKKVNTIDDAIAALKVSAAKTWADYVKEA